MFDIIEECYVYLYIVFVNAIYLLWLYVAGTLNNQSLALKTDQRINELQEYSVVVLLLSLTSEWKCNDSKPNAACGQFA